MSTFKMLKTTPPTFSDRNLNFVVPDSWEKLTQQQLRYVYYAMLNYEGESAKIYILVRLLGLRIYKPYNDGWICGAKLADSRLIRFRMPTWRMQYYSGIINFVDQIPDVPVRIEHVDKCTAADARLQGVSFFDYLQLENLFQGFLIEKKDDQLLSMAKILYCDNKGNHPDKLHASQVELLSVFKWYESVKILFSRYFPFFFQPCTDDDGVERPDMLEIMNSEIRALTGGDVTKEKQVFDMDCWRALTELNAKARETKEFNEKYGQH